MVYGLKCAHNPIRRSCFFNRKSTASMYNYMGILVSLNKILVFISKFFELTLSIFIIWSYLSTPQTNSRQRFLAWIWEFPTKSIEIEKPPLSICINCSFDIDCIVSITTYSLEFPRMYIRVPRIVTMSRNFEGWRWHSTLNTL